jgi:hypothetical protein
MFVITSLVTSEFNGAMVKDLALQNGGEGF